MAEIQQHNNNNNIESPKSTGQRAMEKARQIQAQERVDRAELSKSLGWRNIGAKARINLLRITGFFFGGDYQVAAKAQVIHEQIDVNDPQQVPVVLGFEHATKAAGLVARFLHRQRGNRTELKVVTDKVGSSDTDTGFWRRKENGETGIDRLKSAWEAKTKLRAQSRELADLTMGKKAIREEIKRLKSLDQRSGKDEQRIKDLTDRLNETPDAKNQRKAKIKEIKRDIKLLAHDIIAKGYDRIILFDDPSSAAVIELTHENVKREADPQVDSTHKRLFRECFTAVCDPSLKNKGLGEIRGKVDNIINEKNVGEQMLAAGLVSEVEGRYIPTDDFLDTLVVAGRLAQETQDIDINNLTSEQMIRFMARAQEVLTVSVLHEKFDRKFIAALDEKDKTRQDAMIAWSKVRSGARGAVVLGASAAILTVAAHAPFVLVGLYSVAGHLGLAEVAYALKSYISRDYQKSQIRSQEAYKRRRVKVNGLRASNYVDSLLSQSKTETKNRVGSDIEEITNKKFRDRVVMGAAMVAGFLGVEDIALWAAQTPFTEAVVHWVTQTPIAEWTRDHIIDPIGVTKDNIVGLFYHTGPNVATSHMPVSGGGELALPKGESFDQAKDILTIRTGSHTYEIFNAKISGDGTLTGNLGSTTGEPIDIASFTRINPNQFDFSTSGCFVAGTQILMSDRSLKNIEDVKIGDEILSFDEKTREIVITTVEQVVAPINIEMVFLEFANGASVNSTVTHPYLLKDKGWASFSPEASKREYGIDILKMDVGDIAFVYRDGKLEEVTITNATVKNGETQTYNLSKVLNTHTFFANGILVHNSKSLVDSVAIVLSHGEKALLGNPSEMPIQGHPGLEVNLPKGWTFDSAKDTLDIPAGSGHPAYTLTNAYIGPHGNLHGIINGHEIKPVQFVDIQNARPIDIHNPGGTQNTVYEGNSTNSNSFNNQFSSTEGADRMLGTWQGSHDIYNPDGSITFLETTKGAENLVKIDGHWWSFANNTTMHLGSNTSVVLHDGSGNTLTMSQDQFLKLEGFTPKGIKAGEIINNAYAAWASSHNVIGTHDASDRVAQYLDYLNGKNPGFATQYPHLVESIQKQLSQNGISTSDLSHAIPASHMAGGNIIGNNVDISASDQYVSGNGLGNIPASPDTASIDLGGANGVIDAIKAVTNTAKTTSGLDQILSHIPGGGTTAEVVGGLGGYELITETGRHIAARPQSTTNATPRNPRIAAGFRIARDIPNLGAGLRLAGNIIPAGVRNGIVRAILPDNIETMQRGLAGPRTWRSLFIRRAGLPGTLTLNAIATEMGIAGLANNRAGRIALARQLLEETQPDSRWRVVQLANNLNRSRALTGSTAAGALEVIITPNMAAVAQKPVVTGAQLTSGGVANVMDLPVIGQPLGTSNTTLQQRIDSFTNIIPTTTRAQLTAIARALRNPGLVTDKQIADTIDNVFFPPGDIPATLYGITDADVAVIGPLAGLAATNKGDLVAEVGRLSLNNDQILELGRGLRRVRMGVARSVPAPARSLNELRAEVILNIIVPDIETALHRLPNPDDIAAAFMGVGNDIHAMAVRLGAEMAAQPGKYAGILAQRRAVARAVADLLAHPPANVEEYAVALEKLLTLNETEAFRAIVNDANLIAAVDGMKRPVPADRATAIADIKAYGEKVLGRPMDENDYARLAIAIRIHPPTNADELRDIVERQFIADVSAPLRLIDDANVAAVAIGLGLAVTAGTPANDIRIQIATIFNVVSQDQAIALARLYNDHVRAGHVIDGVFGADKIVEVYMDTMDHVVEYLAGTWGTADQVAVQLGAGNPADLAAKLDAELHQSDGALNDQQRRITVFKAIVAMKLVGAADAAGAAKEFQKALTPDVPSVLNSFLEATLIAICSEMKLGTMSDKVSAVTRLEAVFTNYSITDQVVIMIGLRKAVTDLDKANFIDGLILTDLSKVVEIIPDTDVQAIADGFGVEGGANAAVAKANIIAEINDARAADSLPALTPAELIILGRKLREKTSRIDLIALLNSEYIPSNPNVLLNRLNIKDGQPEQIDLLAAFVPLGISIVDRTQLEAKILSVTALSADRSALYTLLVGKTPAERALVFEEKLLPVQHQLRVDLEAANGSAGIDGAVVITSLNADFGINVPARIANPAIADPVAQLYAYVQGIHGAAMPASADIISKTTAKEVAGLFENLSPFGSLAEAMIRGKVADKIIAGNVNGLLDVAAKIRFDLPAETPAAIVAEFNGVAGITREQKAAIAAFVSDAADEQTKVQEGFSAAAPTDSGEALAALSGIEAAFTKRGIIATEAQIDAGAVAAGITGVEQRAALIAKVGASNQFVTAVTIITPSSVVDIQAIIAGVRAGGMSDPDISAQISVAGLSIKLKAAAGAVIKLAVSVDTALQAGFTAAGISNASTVAETLEAYEGLKEVLSTGAIDTDSILRSARANGFTVESQAALVAKVSSGTPKSNQDSARETFEKVAPGSVNDAINVIDGIIGGISASEAEVLAGFEATSPIQSVTTGVVYAWLIDPNTFTPDAAHATGFEKTNAPGHEDDYVKAWAALEHSDLDVALDTPDAIIGILETRLHITRSAAEQAAEDFGFRGVPI